MSKEEIEKEETFEQYLSKARDRFVIAIQKQKWSSPLRVEAENILIAYDQMRDKLNYNSGWSDEDMINAMKASRLWTNGWLKSTSENLPEFIEEYLNQLKSK